MYLEYLMRPIETDDSNPPMDSWGTQLPVSWQKQNAKLQQSETGVTGANMRTPIFKCNAMLSLVLPFWQGHRVDAQFALVTRSGFTNRS